MSPSDIDTIAIDATILGVTPNSPRQPTERESEAEIMRAHATGDFNLVRELLKRHEQRFPDPANPEPASKQTTRPMPRRSDRNDSAPPLNSITMIQTTIWDNWGTSTRPASTGNKKGDRKIPHQRFGADVEIWTCDPADILRISNLRASVSYRGTTRLIQHDDFAKAITRLLADGKIEQDYHDALVDLLAQGLPTCSYGLLRSKTQGYGRPYAPFNTIRMEVLGGVVETAAIWIGTEAITLSGWTDKTPIGNAPLTEGVLSQSRMDFTSSYPLKDWDSRNEN
jgi:hypothetical protein